MCALQTISNFLNVTSPAASFLGLLSTHRTSDKPVWAVGERDREPPEWMKDFKKNAKEFMENQPRSRSIERYDLPKTKVRKRRSLGSETQNNIPRSKKKISRKDVLLIRERRQSASCVEPQTTSRCVSRAGPTYCKEGFICKNEFNFQWAGIQGFFDAAFFHCLEENNACAQNPGNDLTCRRLKSFPQGSVENPCVCFGYSLVNNVDDCFMTTVTPTTQGPTTISTVSTPNETESGSESGDVTPTTQGPTTISTVSTPNETESGSESGDVTPTTQEPTTISTVSTPNETESGSGSGDVTDDTEKCDKKPFYYAFGAAIAVFGCAVLSTACGLYQCVTKRKQRSRQDQNETSSLSNTIQTFDKDKEECVSNSSSKEDSKEKERPFFLYRIIFFWRRKDTSV